MTDMPNTRIHMLYRDAANWKKSGSIVVSGGFTPEQEAALRATLDDGEYFVPGAVGIEPLGFETENDDDHPYHELLHLESTDDEPTDERTLDQLIEAFQAADWKVAAGETEAA